MTDAVAQKAIALMLLIVTGFLLQKKFKDPISTGAIRYFILNVALPATIFLSVIDIDTQLDLIRLPTFALGVNICLMLVGFLLTSTLLKQTEKSKNRALILLFPSLAPGLTVYPFIEQFLGRSALAWAALADMGNKLFVLIGLYTLAIYWFQQATVTNSSNQGRGQWVNIVNFLLTEPVNLAIIIGVVLAVLELGQDLPLAFTDMVQKFAACATPLILFYVGISLNLKSLQFGTILLVLLAKAGTGFLLSAAALILLQPKSMEEVTLFVALPQASFSLWPLLHATKINSQSEKTAAFFDTEFATAMLALSFPFSIFVLLLIFSSGDFLTSAQHLSWVGGGFLVLFGCLYGMRSLPIRLRNPLAIQVHLQNPIVYRPKPLPIAPPEVLNLKGKPAWKQELETAEMTLTEQEKTLTALHHLLKKYLTEEMQDPAIALRFRYIVEDHQLIIVGQHRTNSVVKLESIRESLELELYRLQIQWVDQLRLYLKLAEQPKPYYGFTISLKSQASTRYSNPSYQDA